MKEDHTVEVMALPLGEGCRPGVPQGRVHLCHMHVNAGEVYTEAPLETVAACNTLQCTATYCSTVQQTTTHCNILQHRHTPLETVASCPVLGVHTTPQHKQKEARLETASSHVISQCGCPDMHLFGAGSESDDSNPRHLSHSFHSDADGSESDTLHSYASHSLLQPILSSLTQPTSASLAQPASSSLTQLTFPDFCFE